MLGRVTRVLSSAALVIVASCGAAQAQFSSDPSVNLLLADRTNEQVQPKIRVAPDNSIYVSWYDNSAGGYDVYLQHLSPQGVELWPHNGIMIADRSYSSNQDYDLRVDPQGNAVLAFNDNRSGTDQVTMTLVSPAGTQLWGPNGVTTSTGTAGKGPPKVALLSDGSFMVGWVDSNFLRFQRVSAGGALVGATFSTTEAGHTLALCDIQASLDGSFIALWSRSFTTNFLSSKYLYAQRYDTAFAPMWPVTGSAVALVVYGPTGAPYGAQGGSVQNGYFPPFLPDGNGGAVFGWYENAGPRSSYVQHVLADGTMLFPANGQDVTAANAALIKVAAGLSYDAATDSIFLAWNESEATTQTHYAIRAQKIVQGPDAASRRAWGSVGTLILPSNSNQSSFIESVAAAGGCYVAAFDARSATTGVVVVSRVNANGTLAWGSETEIACTRVSTKSRLDTTRGVNNQLLMTWGDGPFGVVDIYAQNVNLDGTFGNPACAADFNHDNAVNSQDLFDFLTPFFASDPAADFNHDNSVNSQDFFDFISAFFAGC